MDALRAYIEPARAKNHPLRLVAGTLILGVAYLALSIAVIAVYALVAAPERVFEDFLVSDPWAILVALGSLAAMLPVVFFVVRVIHGQRFVTLFSPGGRIRRRDYRNGFLLALALFALGFLVAAPITGLPHRTSLSVGRALMFAPALIVVIFLQTAAEEFVFRGYFLQRLGALNLSPFVWMGIPSIAFALLHDNPNFDPASRALNVFSVFEFGLVAALLVARTGSLSTAMGFHMGFNLVGFGLLGVEGDITGTQILAYPRTSMLPLFSIEAVLLGLALALLWLRFRPPSPQFQRAAVETSSDM